MTTMADVEQL